MQRTFYINTMQTASDLLSVAFENYLAKIGIFTLQQDMMNCFFTSCREYTNH